MTDGRGSSEASLTELACSFLHRIAARPKMLPYTDMVKWVIDHAEITDKQFKMRNQEVIGSFTPQNLRRMYHCQSRRLAITNSSWRNLPRRMKIWQNAPKAGQRRKSR